MHRSTGAPRARWARPELGTQPKVTPDQHCEEWGGILRVSARPDHGVSICTSLIVIDTTPARWRGGSLADFHTGTNVARLPTTCDQVLRMSWPTREADVGRRYFITMFASGNSLWRFDPVKRILKRVIDASSLDRDRWLWRFCRNFAHRVLEDRLLVTRESDESQSESSGTRLIA